MAQEFQTLRTEVGRAGRLDPRWLVSLIDTMERVARPESRSVPCDPEVVTAFAAHLARPVTAFAHCGSAYSLRN